MRLKVVGMTERTLSVRERKMLFLKRSFLRVDVSFSKASELKGGGNFLYSGAFYSTWFSLQQ